MLHVGVYVLQGREIGKFVSPIAVESRFLDVIECIDLELPQGTRTEPAPTQHKGPLPQDVTLDAALTRLTSGPVEAMSIISIGSGAGADTPFIERFFPGARTLLIDMDARFERDWKELQRTVPSVQWAICGAGAEDSKGFMRKADRTGGAIAAAGDVGATPIEHRRIDSLVEEYGLEPPYFLRFDTHGAELSVLAGATETLKRTSLIQMEVYNDFKLMPFWEMVPHMRTLGFRVLDMCSPLFREDGSFWQMHLFFVRENHPAFGRRSFS